MTGGKLKYIYFLLGGVVLAVIGAQVYWMSNALELQEKNFQRKAKEAAGLTARHLEEHYTCLKIFNKVKLGGNESILLIRRDSTGQRDTLPQYTSGTANNDTVYSFGQLTFPFDVTAEISVRYHYTPADTMGRAGNEPELPSKGHLTRSQAEPYFSGDYPITYVLGGKYFHYYIDSMLDHYFSEKQLSTDHQFTLITGDGQEVLAGDPDLTEKSGSNRLIEVDLYKNNHFFAPHRLLVYLPGQKLSLLKEMWLVMAGSLLVLILMMLVIWYTVKTFLRQKKLSQMKNDFINNMTHEFKTPVANISLALETMNHSSEAVASVHTGTVMDIIREENKKLDDHIDRVLQISMNGNGSNGFQKETLDIHPVIQSLVASYDLKIRSKEGSLHLKLQAERSKVDVDPLHLRNTIGNMIDNAIKYSAGSPDIEIRTQSDTEVLKILIRDHGIGIPKKYHHRIFRKFYRINAGRKHEVKGTGLGLSYARFVIEKHNGVIRVKSRAGKGSTFTIILPLKIEAK